jgi:hypothetical protein
MEAQNTDVAEHTDMCTDRVMMRLLRQSLSLVSRSFTIARKVRIEERWIHDERGFRPVSRTGVQAVRVR